jgi:5'-nucleotidase (lipoprotein e(P4) family)
MENIKNHRKYNMKKLFYSILAILTVLIINLSAVAFNESDITQKELNNQSILGINWIQKSGEYRALAYQAFNIGKVAFNIAISKSIANPAVIVDLDETILDNSPYQASLVGINEGFSNKTWNKWIKTEMTLAVPGAVDFINYVNANRGKVFFISNRGESSTNSTTENDLELATMKNMINLGFMGVTEETLLLKGEFSKTINGKIDTSKKWRMESVANGEVDGKKYNVVIFMGDNLNDFTELDKNDNESRKAFVDKTKQQQGIFIGTENGFSPAYISVPNPMYGDWENGLYNANKFNKSSIWDLTPAQKSMQRIESLNRWNNQ